jgi:hypothetical protein
VATTVAVNVIEHQAGGNSSSQGKSAGQEEFLVTSASHPNVVSHQQFDCRLGNVGRVGCCYCSMQQGRCRSFTFLVSGPVPGSYGRPCLH